MDKTDYNLIDYDNENLESTDDKFAHPQTSEAKEISNFLSQFKKQTSKKRWHVTDTGNLVIRKVSRDDKGSYVCRASNMVGSKSSEAAVLSVHGT